jgi:O-methyltransferase
MNAPMNYMDLVISTVRGISPVPELQNIKVDRSDMAKKHITKLREKYNKRSGNLLIDAALSFGQGFLTKSWNKLSPPALTMCGDASIGQLKEALETIQKENIPGDLIETGVWRGGLPIIMRAFLHSVNDTTRKVYIADSFSGLPQDVEDAKDKAANLLLEPLNGLSTSRKLVEDSLNYFGLNDEQVVFLEGWFKDTLPSLPDRPLALARLDGDYYESTMDAIKHLYPKLSTGGYLIVDDYNLPLGCKKAIDEYREEFDITTPLIKINKQAVYWRKE